MTRRCASLPVGTIGYISGHTGYEIIKEKILLFDTVSCTAVLVFFFLT